MAVFWFGELIRARRESLGISQEELAEGICSVPTISRIENGTRMPTVSHAELLLQRLGLSDIPVGLYTDQEQFEIQRLKIQIFVSLEENDPEQAKHLYRELKRRLPEPDSASRQFLTLYEIILFPEKLTSPQRLETLEAAMRLTCPSYALDRLPRAMAYSEILVLNNIAACYADQDQPETAIRIFRHIVDFYDRGIVNPEEAWRTQPTLYYNLSKLLGLTGRYDECIEVCEKGIRLAKRSGRTNRLSLTYFNCAWSLLKRGNPGDRELAKKYAYRSCCMALALDQPELSRRIEFYKENFGGDMQFLVSE